MCMSVTISLASLLCVCKRKKKNKKPTHRYMNDSSLVKTLLKILILPKMWCRKIILRYHTLQSHMSLQTQTFQALSTISITKNWSQIKVYSDLCVQTVRRAVSHLIHSFQAELKTLTETGTYLLQIPQVSTISISIKYRRLFFMSLLYVMVPFYILQSWEGWSTIKVRSFALSIISYHLLLLTF